MLFYKGDGSEINILDNYIISKRFDVTNTKTFQAHASTQQKIPITVPNGYKVLGLERAWSNGAVLGGHVSSVTNTEVNAWWSNHTNSGAKPTSLSVAILFVRNQ